MKILIVGATGATGRILATLLLQHGHEITVIVRSADRLPPYVRNHGRSTHIIANIAELREADLAPLVIHCDAIASCLGHNANLRGIFGPPRRLVTSVIQKLCKAVQSNQAKSQVKFVLMNTAGNRNVDIHERTSTAQKAVLGLLRLVLPPQADNEQAADYLRTQVGSNDGAIEWVVVRPDTLIDAPEVTDYVLHSSPTTSIFNPRQTSRINVAHFMATLIGDESSWQKWKWQMPVIYNEIPHK